MQVEKKRSALPYDNRDTVIGAGGVEVTILHLQRHIREFGKMQDVPSPIIASMEYKKTLTMHPIPDACE